MKKFVRTLCLATAVCLLASVVACGGGGEDIKMITENSEYKKVERTSPKTVHKIWTTATGGEDSMLIGGFWGPFAKDPNANGSDVSDGVESPNFVTDHYFGLLKDAGVNLLFATGAYWGWEGVSETLDLCQKYGMGNMVLDGTIYSWTAQEKANGITAERLASQLKPFIDHPACSGIYVFDEPFIPHYAAIGEVSELFYASRPGQLIANTVAGYQGFGARHSGYDYYDEIIKYIEDTHARYVCSDIYNWGDVAAATDYLSILSDTYRATKAKNIPLMVMMQSGGHFSDVSDAERTDYYPTEGQFMWNYNLALAYGAKGILFFPLFQPSNYAKSGGDFKTSGLFGADGSVNQWYYYAKKANIYARFIEKILMNATCEGVMMSGELTKAELEKKTDRKKTEVLDSYRELNSVAGEALVGCFDYEGAPAYYVVNYSTETKSDVTLRFSDNYGYDVYQRATLASVHGTTMKLTLAPGEGALVVLR